MKSIDKTVTFWSHRDSYAAPTYYRFGPVIDRYARKVFGMPAGGRVDWLEHLLATVTFREKIPFGRVLSLCCGFGHVERALAKENFGSEILGIDVSQAALDEAIRMAREEGITSIQYRCEDVNHLTLEEGEYDIVYVSGGLHHLQNVDAVIGTVARGIRKGGYFIAFERIGPRYSYPSRVELEVLNGVMHLLPPEFRPQFKIKEEGSLKGVVEDGIKRIINILNRRTSFGRVYFPPPGRCFPPERGTDDPPHRRGFSELLQ
jgi:ubiquinone/menaquinone biosynthesis C-methylase UbiE